MRIIAEYKQIIRQHPFKLFKRMKNKILFFNITLLKYGSNFKCYYYFIQKCVACSVNDEFRVKV